MCAWRPPTEEHDQMAERLVTTRPMRTIARYSRRFAPELIALAMLGVALTLAIRTTADLSWPPKDDFYRQIGGTQSVLDGRPSADPGYLGEGRWYNPLVPRLVAWIAPHVDLPLPTLYTRAGPYFNLIVPVAFYSFVCVLFGRWAAVTSLGIFLFATSPLVPPRVLGTYSPWFWARNFAQGLFFITAATSVLAFRSGMYRWAFIAGVALGLTFLTHTAPALIIVLFVLMMTGLDWLRPGRPDGSSFTRSASMLLIIGGTSFAVCFPFLMQLFVDYGFEVKNWAPSHLVGLYVRQIASAMFSVRTALAIFGGVLLLRPPASMKIKPASRIALMILLLATLLPLFYGIVVRFAAYRGVELRQLVPEFHFHIYFTAIQAVFAGVGLCYLARRFTPKLAQLLRRNGIDPDFGAPRSLEPFVLVGLLTIITAGGFGFYLSSPDMRQFREDSLERAQRSNVTQLYDWALHNTESNDVFLVEPLLGLYAISSAARKVVVLPRVYSNPYVDYEKRRRDAVRMYEYLRSGEEKSFLALASDYHVRYVVDAKDAPKCCMLEAIDSPNFRVVFERDALTVYEVDY